VPWFAMSRNGERVFVSQSQAQGFSGRPPIVFNAADYALSWIPMFDDDNERNLLNASLSDDGSRLVTSSGRIRDGNFAPIGYVSPEPDNYVGLASVVSPDGRRAYQLAYEAGDILDPLRVTPLYTPRVYVFDISTAGGPGVRMPRVGYFTFPDFPSCVSVTQPGCQRDIKAAISGDGGTLMFAGDRNMVSVPIPPESSMISKASPPRVGKQPMQTRRWDVNTRSR
jgi:hypothetical protein